MPSKRLEERFAYEGGKVDRTGPRPIVRGVLLCGPTSANRRRYAKEAFAGDRVKKYDGRPVFLNHGDGRSGRRYEDRIAKVVNPRHRADGMPIGDLEVRPKHPFAELLLDDAENDGGSIGMSHVAHCQTRPGADGWEDVSAVESVESVDVVLDPATTKGLYESTGGQRVSLFVKQLTEALVKHPKVTAKVGLRLKRLGEMDGMDAAPTAMDAPPADDADPDDAVMAAFKAAIADVVDKAMSGDLDPKAALGKIKSLLTSHAGLNDDGKTPDTDADPTTPESKRPSLRDVIAECEAAKLPDPPVKLAERLTTIADKDTRAFVIEQAKRTTEGGGRETPIAAGRDRAAPLAEGKRTEEAEEAKAPASYWVD